MFVQPLNEQTMSAESGGRDLYARRRGRTDALANRRRLRLAVLSAMGEIETDGSANADADRWPSYEQVVLRVFREHIDLGPVASRRAVEQDVDAIADTVAELLAAVPSQDGPWGPAIGPVYRTDQVRVLLGNVSRQALADRAKRHTLFALQTRDGVTVYPAWQFVEGQVLPGLADVLKPFAADEHGEVVDGWTLASWLRTGVDQLDGGSVIERLRDGDIHTAARVAAHTAARWVR